MPRKDLEKRNSKKKRKGGRCCWADSPPFRPARTRGPAPPHPRARVRPTSPPPTATMWQPYTGDGRPRPLRPRLLVGSAVPLPRPTSILHAPSLSLLPHMRAQQQQRRSAVRHRQSSSARYPDHPRPIKPSYGSASMSSTPCASSRLCASR